MERRWLVVWALIVGCGPREARVAALGSEPGAAVRRALPLMQASAEIWIKKRECASCHHQALGTVAITVARAGGFAVDEKLAARQLARVRSDLVDDTDALIYDYIINGQIGQSYMSLALAVAGATQGTGPLIANYFAGKQAADGHWRSESHRPPLEDSAVTATALCLRALQVFAPPRRRAEMEARVARGRAWLERVTPRDTEDRAMQILGVWWAGGDVGERAAALAAEQRPDGGWAQLPTRPSDAYATGKVLTVLAVTGQLTVDAAAYARGVAFLLGTQERDGSWHVHTRRRDEGLPYFETGFPHGEDQFISFAGTAWAVMALTLATKPETGALFARLPPPAPDTPPATLDDALVAGTLDDVDRLLPGANVDAMAMTLAARDADRVRRLLARGADPEMHAENGVTPLMIAAFYDGALPAVEALLAAGARPATADKYGLTPLMRVARSGGDLAKARRLLDAGAPVDAVEEDGRTAFRIAASSEDLEMMTLLLERGAKVDPVDPKWKDTPLIEGAVKGRLEVLKLLLDHQARVDFVDKDGRSALWWASTVDFGSPADVEALLAHGARPDFAAGDGSTPLSQARKHRPEVVPLLEKAARQPRGSAK